MIYMSVFMAYKKDRAKYLTPIRTREEYLAHRDSAAQRMIMGKVRKGNEKMKGSLVQMVYSCLPNEDGTLKKSKHMSSTIAMDVDHIPAEEMEPTKQRILEKKDELGLLMLEVSARGEGYHLVFRRRPELSQENNLKWASELLGVKFDSGAKDITRVFYTTTNKELLFLDDRIFEVQEVQEVQSLNDNDNDNENKFSNSQILDKKTCQLSTLNSQLEYKGVSFQKIIDAWSKQRFSEDGASRHDASVRLARDLYIMTDRDKAKTLSLLLAQPWVQEIIEERNEDVERTVNDAAEYVAAQESENAKKGKAWLPKISKEMKAALEAVGAEDSGSKIQPSDISPQTSADEDVYSQLPLDEWAKELEEMAGHYPCMKELFINVHPHKMPAVLFASAALFGTLMTRAWYHFWYEPEIIRRLNYCIFIIGDPGAGKNIVEKFYKKIADPMIQADSCLIDAVNRYKEGRTERTTSTKAQKGEALKRPVVGIRVHPARTATGEFIRHMNAAIETIQGVDLNLHMFSFDAELDNVTKQNKGGDWKDREILELKAFHNEEDGQMYANQESVTGMFNVYWNFIYTGTPYALHRKVNQRNFGTGMSTRLAVIPLPDKGLAKRHQQVDAEANETLKTWAYRLDKVEGELPIEALNDETYEWQSQRMEVAEFNGDKADRTLLKRIPYYGIGISLPFILMRHWDEWQESSTLTKDERDRKLCKLAMEIQYRCQKFFFGEMAFNYFADQNKEFVVRKRTTRYDMCFRKLPEEFKTQQFMDCFGMSQPSAWKAMNRLINDGVIKKVSYGVYHKLMNELP